MTIEDVIVESVPEENLPALIQDAPVVASPMSLGDIMELGNVLVRSGMFRSTVSAEQAVAKVLAGRELGLGPIASMTHVFVIDGKVGLSAGLIGSKIRQHPDYDFKVTEHSEEECAIEFFYRGEIAGTSSFSVKDAEQAGLLRQGSPWTKYPRNMVYARALTNGARWYAPDAFGGSIYTPEELGASVKFDATGQETVESVPTATPLSAPNPDMVCPEHGGLEWRKSEKQAQYGKDYAHKQDDGWCERDAWHRATYQPELKARFDSQEAALAWVSDKLQDEFPLVATTGWEHWSAEIWQAIDSNLTKNAEESEDWA
jgi:hypothetical protein